MIHQFSRGDPGLCWGDSAFLLKLRTKFGTWWKDIPYAFCSGDTLGKPFSLLIRHIFSIVMHQSWGNTLAIKVPHLVVAKSPGCLGATQNKQVDSNSLVMVPWCHNCSSKLCLQVGTCETRSPQLMQFCPNYKFGTASFQLPSSTTSTTATRYRVCAGKKSEAAKL